MKTLAQFYEKHPRLVTWFVLAVGMVLIILLSTRQVPLLGYQRLAIVIITILLAGGCAWLIYWE